MAKHMLRMMEIRAGGGTVVDHKRRLLSMNCFVNSSIPTVGYTSNDVHIICPWVRPKTIRFHCSRLQNILWIPSRPYFE